LKTGKGESKEKWKKNKEKEGVCVGQIPCNCLTIQPLILVSIQGGTIENKNFSPKMVKKRRGAKGKS